MRKMRINIKNITPSVFKFKPDDYFHGEEKNRTEWMSCIFSLFYLETNTEPFGNYGLCSG